MHQETNSGERGLFGDWRNHAACQTVDPELFFPVGKTKPELEHVDRAKEVCGNCPVRSQCLQYALETNQDHGIWGGLTEDERRAMKRRARYGRIGSTALGRL